MFDFITSADYEEDSIPDFINRKLSKRKRHKSTKGRAVGHDCGSENEKDKCETGAGTTEGNGSSGKKSPPSSLPLLLNNNTDPTTVLTPPSRSRQIITINVAGLRYQTFLSTLEQYQETLLGCAHKRSRYFNPDANEYFFDRHRYSFDSILYFYQSGGILRRPSTISIDIFIDEVKFFELGDNVLEQFWEGEGYVKPHERVVPKNLVKRAIWLWMEHPDSSMVARITGFFSVFVIIISTMSFCLETLERFKNKYGTGSGGHSQNWNNPFFVTEVLCISWFTFEFVLRLASSPSKLTFCRGFLNWVDFIAIAPFYINIGLKDKASGKGLGSFAPILRVLRLFRVFRIFKLSRHSRGLRILGETLKASIRELCLLVFFLMIAVILFSSVIYYAEFDDKKGVNSTNQFISIPEGFWYTVVTMTTIGYGDITPKKPIGKVIGSLCAIAGVLVIALPVPVIVENFKHFYRQENRLAYMAQLASINETGEKGRFDTLTSCSS